MFSISVLNYESLCQKSVHPSLPGLIPTSPPPLDIDPRAPAIAHHSQQLPVLLEGGAAAQHARYHDDGSGQDQYVGGGDVRLGGQQADVVALLDQGPDAHRQDDAPCQLEAGAQRWGWGKRKESTVGQKKTNKTRKTQQPCTGLCGLNTMTS